MAEVKTDFANALHDQLGSKQYVGKLTNDRGDAFYSIEIQSHRPSLTIMYKDKLLDDSCSLWEIIMSDDVMTRHMEEDVEISTPLHTFAVYFCDSIINGPIIEAINESSTSLVLKLTYSIGNMSLEGKLKIPSLQKNIHLQAFSMMNCLYLDRRNQLTREEWVLKPKPNSSNVVVNKLGGMSNGAPAASVEFPGADSKEQEEQDFGPVKAKKRKAGGVSLFAKKK